ncbi:MAG TPA: DinB family protein [Vicinamibacterales bacterium]|nr:DinB family protein [Vicinamibacterales bacterium]
MRVSGLIAVCCLGLVAAGTTLSARQQTAPAPAQPRPLPTLVVEVQNIFNNIRNNMTKAADQFPEDKYGWSPTPDVRTWGGLLQHIIDDNNGACFLLAGETAAQPRLDNGGKPTDAGKGMTKAAIVKALADSFARCDKAFAAVTTENMLERNGTGNRSKIGALIYDTQHINEHYGNIVTYMRLQGMVPPSSAPRGGGPAR